MWVYTVDGHFSAVQTSAKPGHLMVRARSRGDIQRFQARFCPKATVVKTPVADYLYRVVVPEAVWVTAVMVWAGEIDYENFKAEVLEVRGKLRFLEFSRVHDAAADMKPE